MPMDLLIRRFEKYLKAKLTAEQYEQLPYLVGVTDKRWRHYLGGTNKNQSNLGKMIEPEITALAKLLKVPESELIEEFGCGMDMEAFRLRDYVNGLGKRLMIVEHAA